MSRYSGGRTYTVATRVYTWLHSSPPRSEPALSRVGSVWYFVTCNGELIQMGLADVPIPRCKEAPAEAAAEREELVHRVASSSTFERSPRLRAFFLHVCRCALDNKPEGATEQQVGICVYDRPPGYNPNEDNIVRSQARLLRLKLEHHFANEGKDEAIMITIPKGRYLPAFETRSEEPVILHGVPHRAGQVSPFTADPGWNRRAVRTRDYLAWLPLVQVEIRHSTGYRRSCGPGHPPGSERGSPAVEKPTARVSPRRRRSPYRRRSYRGSLCGRVGAPLGSGPLLRRRRSPAWPEALLSPCGR